jgi:RNA polymerase sigma-70 factor (ECF subfamily)
MAMSLVAAGPARPEIAEHAGGSVRSRAIDESDDANTVPDQSVSDRELLGRIANGSRPAMEALYRRHHVGMFRFVLRITHNESVAEDVIGEAFLDVWRQADRFEGRSAVSTWLFSIARFKALSALRQHLNPRRTEEIDEETHQAPDDPTSILEQTQRNGIIRNCLNKLSASHREVLDLVYYHHKSCAETAEILGIPNNTVKGHLFRARRRLAELLKLSGIDGV